MASTLPSLSGSQPSPISFRRSWAACFWSFIVKPRWLLRLRAERPLGLGIECVGSVWDDFIAAHRPLTPTVWPLSDRLISTSSVAAGAHAAAWANTSHAARNRDAGNTAVNTGPRA